VNLVLIVAILLARENKKGKVLRWRSGASLSSSLVGAPRNRASSELTFGSMGDGATLPFPFTSIAKCVRDDLLDGHGLSHRYCSRLAPRCLDECPLGGEGRAERVGGGGEGLAGTSQGLDLLRYLPTALPLGYPEVVIHLQPEPEGGTYPRPAR
jgi:hypothetical protein